MSRGRAVSLCAGLALVLFATCASAADTTPASEKEAKCRELLKVMDVTVTLAEVEPATKEAPEHCYIRGTILPSIRFHMQLPLPENWNGRLVNIGDGGKDGDLDYMPER